MESFQFPPIQSWYKDNIEFWKSNFLRYVETPGHLIGINNIFLVYKEVDGMFYYSDISWLCPLTIYRERYSILANLPTDASKRIYSETKKVLLSQFQLEIESEGTNHENYYKPLLKLGSDSSKDITSPFRFLNSFGLVQLRGVHGPATLDFSLETAVITAINRVMGSDFLRIKSPEAFKIQAALDFDAWAEHDKNLKSETIRKQIQELSSKL